MLCDQVMEHSGQTQAVHLEWLNQTEREIQTAFNKVCCATLQRWYSVECLWLCMSVHVYWCQFSWLHIVMMNKNSCRTFTIMSEPVYVLSALLNHLFFSFFILHTINFNLEMNKLHDITCTVESVKFKSRGKWMGSNVILIFKTEN